MKRFYLPLLPFTLLLLGPIGFVQAEVSTEMTSQVITTAAMPFTSEALWPLMALPKVTTLNVVEQLQQIHRLGQDDTQASLVALVEALQSPLPLARRKAARSLLERTKTLPPDEKKLLFHRLEPVLNATDPVVQRDLIRVLAVLETPEALAWLHRFFEHAEQSAQLNAVDTLTQDEASAPRLLQLVQSSSKYPNVRQAAILK